MKKFVFDYNHEESYDTNFKHWYSENSAERRYYKERVYPIPEAKLVFDKMYGKYRFRVVSQSA